MKLSVVMGFIFALLFSTYSTAEARSFSSSRGGGSSFHSSSSTSKSYSKPSTSSGSTSTKITLSKPKSSSSSTKIKPKTSKSKTKVTSPTTKTNTAIVPTTTNKTMKKKNKYPRTVRVAYTFPKGSEGYGKGKYYAFDITIDDLDIIPLKKNKEKEYYMVTDGEKEEVTVGKGHEYPNYVYAKKKKGTFKMTFKSKREYTVFKKEMKDKDNPMTLKIK
jgi:hypothetical protein